MATLTLIVVAMRWTDQRLSLIGTNVKQLGFAVSFQKFEDGVWFPVSYGGEFELKVVFLYKRKISISMTNTGFERVAVSSNITYSPDVP